LKSWVTKQAGHYTGDTFEHGGWVVYRYVPTKERMNHGNSFRKLFKDLTKYDGEGYFFYGKVSYGWLEDNYGRNSESYNDGEYGSSKELLECLRIWADPQEVKNILK